MTLTVTRTALAAVLLALLVPMTAAVAATPAGYTATIPDTDGPHSLGFGATQGITQMPADGHWADLTKVSVTADAAHHTLTLDFVVKDELSPANCPRTAAGPRCRFYVRFSGVSSKTDYQTQYDYNFRLFPWLGPGGQVAVVHSSQNNAFTRNLQVLRTTTWGHHMVVTVSTARFLDARIRLFGGVDWQGSIYGCAQALTDFYGNASHTEHGTVYDYSDYKNIPDVLVR